jgi:hypothetical protein
MQWRKSCDAEGGIRILKAERAVNMGQVSGGERGSEHLYRRMITTLGRTRAFERSKIENGCACVCVTQKPE